MVFIQQGKDGCIEFVQVHTFRAGQIAACKGLFIEEFCLAARGRRPDGCGLQPVAGRVEQRAGKKV